ncbi:MAG: hypothetical protein WD467_03510 [Candidatus Saccharimonadales bacterium]
MAVIDTSTVSTATAYSNQRKVDRCQNGVLWSFFNNGSGVVEPWYSEDDGVTWTNGGANFSTNNASYTPNFSVFIDLDDYCHVVYKNGNSGYIEYRRGTPNAGRTAWTWTSAHEVFGHASFNYPDLVAHREGSGWAVHLAAGYVTTGYAQMYGHRFDIDSGGTITPVSLGVITNNYNSGVQLFPSIDFNHTGDGKTVAGSTPHIYMAWSAGATGTGNGVRFKKATYSGGSWTWGTEREIDSTRYFPFSNRNAVCLFDGTRVIIAGHVYDASGNDDIVLYERDVADTTTTTRILLDNANSNQWHLVGSYTYDGEGNVYYFGVNNGELIYRKWVRATTTFEAEVIIDSTNISNSAAWVSTKRGHSSNRIEYIYTDGVSSPYNITYGSILLNTAPTTPTILTPIVNERVHHNSIDFSWSFNDPDGGDSQSAYALRRQLDGGSEEWWDGSTWVGSEVFVSTASTTVSIHSDTFESGTYSWSVVTQDQAGATSGYSIPQNLKIIRFERWGAVQI